MVQTQIRTLATTKEWTGVALTGNEFDIPTDFLIQQIIIDFSGDLDIATGVSVLVEDALQEVISKIKLEATGKGGSKTIVSAPGVDIFHKNFFDYDFGRFMEVDLQTPITTRLSDNGTIRNSLVEDFKLGLFEDTVRNISHIVSEGYRGHALQLYMGEVTPTRASQIGTK